MDKCESRSQQKKNERTYISRFFYFISFISSTFIYYSMDVAVKLCVWLECVFNTLPQWWAKYLWKPIHIHSTCAVCTACTEEIKGEKQAMEPNKNRGRGYTDSVLLISYQGRFNWNISLARRFIDNTACDICCIRYLLFRQNHSLSFNCSYHMFHFRLHFFPFALSMLSSSFMPFVIR